MSKVLVEYSNAISAGKGRMIETTEGRKVADLRSLGCPEEIIAHVEGREAPVADSEADAMRALLAAQAQVPVAL